MRAADHAYVGGGRKFVAVTGASIVVLLSSLAFVSCTAGEVKYPLREYSKRMVACLQALGWDAVPIYNNGVTTAGNLPDDGVESYNRDVDSCQAEYGYDVARDPTDHQLRTQWLRSIETRGCLIGQGYDIPDMPSEREFVDAFREGEPWTVSSFVELDDLVAIERLFAKCVPPEWWPDY